MIIRLISQSGARFGENPKSMRRTLWQSGKSRHRCGGLRCGGLRSAICALSQQHISEETLARVTVGSVSSYVRGSFCVERLPTCDVKPIVPPTTCRCRDSSVTGFPLLDISHINHEVPVSLPSGCTLPLVTWRVPVPWSVCSTVSVFAASVFCNDTYDAPVHAFRLRQRWFFCVSVPSGSSAHETSVYFKASHVYRFFCSVMMHRGRWWWRASLVPVLKIPARGLGTTGGRSPSRMRLFQFPPLGEKVLLLTSMPRPSTRSTGQWTSLPFH